MKMNLFRRAVVVCAGAAFFLGVAQVRAQNPDGYGSAAPRDKKEERAKPTNQSTKAKVKGSIPTRDVRHSKYSPGRQAGGSNGEETAVLTGSNIPRKYRRRGYNTDSGDNVFIYDQNDIRFRSSGNVSDQLRTVPGLSVRGGR